MKEMLRLHTSGKHAAVTSTEAVKASEMTEGQNKAKSLV